MFREPTGVLALSVAWAALADAPADRFAPADLARHADLTEPEFSPDGELLAYAVATSNVEADQRTPDLWRVRFDGRDPVQLTHTPEHSEWLPRWSPDGRRRAYLQGGDDRPADLSAVERRGLRPLTAHNDWLATRREHRLGVVLARLGGAAEAFAPDQGERPRNVSRRAPQGCPCRRPPATPPEPPGATPS